MENYLADISLDNLWNDCMNFIKQLGILSNEQFNSWFLPLRPMRFENNRLDLSVPSAFFAEHLELNYNNILFPAIKKVFGSNVVLFYNYLIASDDASSKMTVKTENQSAAIMPHAEGVKVQTSPFQEAAAEEPELDSQLNPRYNFSNYCVSSSNKLARSIGEAIVTDPKCKTFNPLFIHGSSGVGKTHLMQAIGIGVKENNPSARVLYVTARLFESQFVFATRTGKQNDFLRFYQSIDCLLIDDIQDLIGKEKTQKAFFHIFNHLHLNNKQIIMTSDCAPAMMQGMPERLLSRFKWGMTVELERPDYELRLQVLRQKALTEGVSLPEEVLEYVARNITDSIRELEGIMVSLMARATFMGQELSVELVEGLIENTSAKKKATLNFDFITQCVSSYYQIEPDALFTKDRRREISDARQMVMYLAKKHTGMKFKAIATRMARNHSTVMHACNSIEARLSIEKQLQRDIETIEKSFAD